MTKRKTIYKFGGSFSGIGIILLIMAALASCNKNEVIMIGTDGPKIILDIETGVYTVKVGKELTISPEVRNTGGARYLWISDGETIGTGPELVRTFGETGSVYITFRVETAKGSAEADLRVDVSELAPPAISLAVPSGGMTALRNREYVFCPDIRNEDSAVLGWYLDGEVVGSERNYTFMQQETGTYELKITAENEDGSAEKTVVITVVDALPVEIIFPKPMWNADPLKKSVSLGRTVYLRPYVADAVDPVYSWSVDGVVVQEGVGGRLFPFTPAAKGEYKIILTVTDTPDDGPDDGTRNITRSGSRITTVELRVTCYDAESQPINNTTGKASWNKIYEYLPAPGQFIGDPLLGGFGSEQTLEEAAAYAEKRMSAGSFVSLGGFGGYVIAGFDHSILNSAGYDFSVSGNQSSTSSEPGIVWVMQDTNGNGLPDDEWYELRGSEYGKQETRQEYAVTYYRPGGQAMNVPWTDNCGNSGYIDYLADFHAQDHYYPAWMEPDSYTLYGTCLAHRTAVEGGQWVNGAFDWGYADNRGNDMGGGSANGEDAAKTYFKISNAVNPDGTNANLQYIDFVKVQTGVNAKAGWMGEVSTEIFGLEDENL